MKPITKTKHVVHRPKRKRRVLKKHRWKHTKHVLKVGAWSVTALAICYTVMCFVHIEEHYKPIIETVISSVAARLGDIYHGEA